MSETAGDCDGRDQDGRCAALVPHLPALIAAARNREPDAAEAANVATFRRFPAITTGAADVGQAIAVATGAADESDAPAQLLQSVRDLIGGLTATAATLEFVLAEDGELAADGAPITHPAAALEPDESAPAARWSPWRGLAAQWGGTR